MIQTSSPVLAGVTGTFVGFYFAVGSNESWKTVADVTVYSVHTSTVNTRRINAVIDVCFTMSPSKSNEALTIVSVNSVHTCGGVQTRIAGTFINFVQAEKSCETSKTEADKTINLVLTDGLNAAGIAAAFIDINLTDITAEPRRTGTRESTDTIDTSCSDHARVAAALVDFQ